MHRRRSSAAPACLLVVLCLLGGALAGCGPQQGGTVVLSPLRAVDWASAVYPSTCFSPGPPVQVRVRDFRATGPDGFLQMDVRPPTYVRVAGRQLAVLTYRCVGANAGPDTALVYQLAGGAPRLVATLLGGDDVYVTTVSASDGTLVLSGRGYRPNTPQCCPDLAVSYRYRWAGDTLVAAGHTASLLSPTPVGSVGSPT